MNLLIVQISPS